MLTVSCVSTGSARFSVPGSVHFSVHLCRLKPALPVGHFHQKQTRRSAPPFIPHPTCRDDPLVAHWAQQHFTPPYHAGSARFSVHLLEMHPLGCINMPTKVGAPGKPGAHTLACIFHLFLPIEVRVSSPVPSVKRNTSEVLRPGTPDAALSYSVSAPATGLLPACCSTEERSHGTAPDSPAPLCSSSSAHC